MTRGGGGRPTILDVAREAGVSKSTVSLVLRGSPQVRADTRARVEAAMAGLGYVYDRRAAGMRGAASGLVGLVINDLRNPFFTEFAASAQMAFAREGYATVIANTDEDAGIQDRVVASMIEHGVAAIVLSPAYGAVDATLARLARAGLPTLQVLRAVDARPAPFPFVAFDYREGGRLAARCLIEAGSRRVAFVGGVAGRPVTTERMAGYLDALAAAGQAPCHFDGRPSRVLGRDVARRIARAHPEIDAAVCFSDLVALGMLAGFAEAGVRPGAGFRLVGFDDIEEAALAYPALSSVRCDSGALGEHAAATILRWIREGRRPPDCTRMPVRLIERQSSAGPRPPGVPPRRNGSD